MKNVIINLNRSISRLLGRSISIVFLYFYMSPLPTPPLGVIGMLYIHGVGFRFLSSMCTDKESTRVVDHRFQ